MKKHYLFHIVVLVFVAALSHAVAQEVVEVSFHGLGELLELREHDDGSLQRHLRHRNALPSTDPLRPFDRLTTSGPAPEHTLPIADVVVHRWVEVSSINDVLPQTPSAEAYIAGTKAWKPVYAVDIHPWKTLDGMLWLADSLTVTVSFVQQTIPNDPNVYTPRTPTLENAIPNAQTPTVKLATRIDGIAVQTGSAIGAVEPRLLGQPLSNLALFYKNVEQPIHVVDENGDGLFSSTDRILFRGRRPEGDTSWFDWDNNDAIHFLTVKTDGLRKRYSVNSQLPTGDLLTSLSIHRHIEMDTGFYHLGSAIDPVFAEYNSDRVWLEGYYWDALNANGYERMTYRFPFAPADEGTFSVTAHYVGATDAVAFNPDTRADLTVNALNKAHLISDSIGQYAVTVTSPVGRTPHGIQSLKFYSTGIDEHRGEPKYFSEVLLDWFEITASAAPVFESGRLHGGVVNNNSPQQIELSNASSPSGFVLDTLMETVSVLTKVSDATVVRFGLSTQDHNWIMRALDEKLWHGSVIIDNESVDLDSVNDIVLVARLQSAVTTTTLSSGQLITAIDGLQTGTAFALFNSGVAVPTAIKDALLRKGLAVPAEKTWAQGGVLGREVSVQVTNQPTDILGDIVVDRSSASSFVVSAAIPAGPKRELFFADESGLEVAQVLRSNLSDLASTTSQADVVFVTHSSHREQAERLAAHRERQSNVTTRVVDIDAILDEFGAGHRSAEALRDYLAYTYAASDLPRMQYVVLIGNSSWDPRVIVKKGNVGARRVDQVPTYGRPSSDYYFGLLDNPLDYAVPEVIVGRIPGLQQSEVRNHIDKIIAYDTTTISPWMRKFLFVGGGSEAEGLCEIYDDMLSDPFETGVRFTDSPLCLDTLTLCKYTAPPNAGFFIRQGIDAGLGWMNYIGHGSTELFDITGWEPKDLTNKGRYGVLATYACQTGSYSNPSVECKNSQYLSVPDVGFAAAVGGTGWAYKLTISFLHFSVHETMRNEPIRGIGEIVYSAKLPFARSGDQNGINTVMQYCILGDPLMRVRIDTTLETYVRSHEVSVTTIDGTSELTDEEEYAIVRIPVHSAGTGTDTPVPVWLIRTFGGTTDTVKTNISGLCLSEGVRFELPIFGMKGEHQARVVVDPYFILGDNTTDNVAPFVFTVLPRSLLPVHPLPHMVVDGRQIHIRLLDPLSLPEEPLAVHVALCTGPVLDSETLVLKSAETQIDRTGTIVDWKVDLGSQPLNAGTYWLHAWTEDPGDGERSADLIFAIAVTNDEVVSDTNSLVATQLHHSPEPEHVTYNQAGDRYELASIEKEIFLRSSGIQTEDPTIESMLDMKIGDVLYVNNPYYRGFNLVVVSEVDTIPRAIRRYDTWKFPLPIEAGHNGFSEELLTFLQDSVGPNDRVLFAIAYESLTGFIEDGNLDSLRVLLKSMGSAYADSLGQNSSWAMIGQLGLAPGEAPEAWKGSPDSMVTVTAPIPFYSTEATVHSPWIGPIRKLTSVTVDRSPIGVSTIIEGRNDDGVVSTIGVLIQDQATWLPNPDSASTFIRVTHRLQYQPDDTASVFVSTSAASYVPADEWVVEKEALTVEPSNALRGDTVNGTITVRSSNVFRPSLPTTALFVLSSEDGQERSRQSEVLPSIGIGEAHVIDAQIETTLGAENSIVFVKVNESGVQPELYDFNNLSSDVFSNRDDTVSPVIKTYADSVDVTAGAYVQPQPSIEVYIYDNSKLPINDINNLTVFVNGDRIRENVSRGFKFLPTDSVRTYYTDPDLRAVMKFEYDLDVGQNNLLVRALDATGNNAEHLSELWVSTTTQIDRVTPSPNPSNGAVTFRIDLRSPVKATPSTLRIFDATGRLIATIESVLRTGSGVVEWDGKSTNGVSIPSGAYFYRLDVVGHSSTEPAGTSGTLMILR